jgi:hypothetical protein
VNKPNWRKIGLIGGGVFLVLIVIGALAGDPDEEKVAAGRVTTSTTGRVTTTRAPATTTAPATTEAPRATQAPTATQPPAPTEAAAPTPTAAPRATAPPATEGPFAGETVSQRNARQKAAKYLEFTSFSRSGLIEQLEYDGFAQGDAEYGADALNVDWNEQATKKAAKYLEFTSFSHSGLVEQLVYDGFTQAEAEYGVSTTGL